MKRKITNIHKRSCCKSDRASTRSKTSARSSRTGLFQRDASKIISKNVGRAIEKLSKR